MGELELELEAEEFGGTGDEGDEVATGSGDACETVLRRPEKNGCTSFDR
jgi:hypothetical protein